MRFALLPDKICFTIALYHIGRSKCRKAMEYPLREIRPALAFQCLFPCLSLFVGYGRGIGADAGQEQNTQHCKGYDRFFSFDDCRRFCSITLRQDYTLKVYFWSRSGTIFLKHYERKLFWGIDSLFVLQE